MSAQLEHSHRPRATPHLRAVPLAPSSGPTESRSTPPDADRGSSLLLTFTGAVAVMVADVVVIGAVEESWILIPGFIVLVLVTVIVFTVTMRLLADSGEKATPDAR
jgi:hypothetical protein